MSDTPRSNDRRINVFVIAEHDLQGVIHPLSFRTPEGVNVEIDRVIRVQDADVLKTHGKGICYDIRVTYGDRQVMRKLYQRASDGRWFVERD